MLSITVAPDTSSVPLVCVLPDVAVTWNLSVWILKFPETSKVLSITVAPETSNVLSITVAPETSSVELMAVVVIVVSPVTSNVPPTDRALFIETSDSAVNFSLAINWLFIVVVLPEVLNFTSAPLETILIVLPS